MANDPNRSNRGPQNTLSDNGFSDIENIGRRSGRHTAEDIAQRMRLSEARGNIDVFEAGLQSSPPAGVAEMMTRQLANERKMVNALEPRIGLRADTQRQRFTNMTQSAIERQFAESSVNGQASFFGRSSAGSRFSMGMMNSSYEDLESNRKVTMNQIGALGQRAMGLAEGMYDERGQQDPGKLAQLQQIYSQRQRLVNKVGGIDAAQRQQRQLGLDPESQTDRLMNAGANAQRTLAHESLAAEMRAGKGDFGGKSAVELKQREVQLSQQLVDALEKLKDTAGRSAEEIDKMKNAATKTADDLDKVKEAQNIRRSGGGGNGRYDTAGSMLNFASGAFGAVGSGIQAIAVNQRLGQTANISGYAGIENDKYNTYRSASAGSIASQLALSQYGGAEDFGRQLRLGANAATGAYAAGGVAQMAAGGVRIASTMNPGENLISTSAAMSNRLQGVGDVLSGGVNAGVAGADLYRDVSGSGAGIAGVNASMDARRALMHVTSEQLQGFRDFGVGMGSAAMGMGSSGGGFISRMVSNSMMGSMANSRLSPEQMASMAQMGVAGIGSTFNESQVFGARGLERSGLGSMGENMSRMASLASAGTNNPQTGLTSVLEAAFTKSLDGSKTLNMMVENTSNMVQASVGRAMGIDTTAASAQILAAGVNTADPNQEHAMQRAASAAERMRMIGTDTGTNFAAMSATARISKMTGLSGTEAILAQGIDDQTLRAMKTMKPNEIRTKLFDRGIDVAEGKEQQMVAKLTEARLITNLQGGGAGLASGVNADLIASKIMAGTPLNRNEQLSYNQASSFNNFSGGVEAQRAATALISDNPNAISVAKASAGIRGEGGTEQQKMLDDMRTQGFKQLSQAAMEATAGFKSAAEALSALGALAKQVENVGDTGGEGKFKTAAADAAGTFGKSTIRFEESVGHFTKAVTAMMSRSGINSADESTKLLEGLKRSTSRQSAPGK